MNLLEVSGLVTRYGPVTAVDGVSLVVPKGRMVGVIGRNGAGKSSLLRTICGLEKASAGSVTLAGKRLDRRPAHEVLRSGVAYVPEGRRVFAEMTVLENLKVGAFSKITSGRAAEVERLLGRVHGIFPVLSERANQLAGTLSGGQQQMLAIARALMSEPELLMLDEPSMGLAPVVFHALFDTIKRLNAEGLSILLVEQKAYLTLRLIDHGYVLANGRVTIEGDGPTLLADAGVRAAYLGQAETAGPSEAAPATLASPPAAPLEEPAMATPYSPSTPPVVAELSERRQRLVGNLDERLRVRARAGQVLPLSRPAQEGAPTPRLGLTREQDLAARHRKPR